MRVIQFIGMIFSLALTGAITAVAYGNDDMSPALDGLEKGRGNSVEAAALSDLKATAELSTRGKTYRETAKELIGDTEILITSDLAVQVPVAKTTFGRKNEGFRLCEVGGSC